jgi:hypothetical protein
MRHTLLVGPGFVPTLTWAQGELSSTRVLGAQRQYALERLEVATREKAECPKLYSDSASYFWPCEVTAERWRLYWNDRYLAASKEYERLVNAQKKSAAPPSTDR